MTRIRRGRTIKPEIGHKPENEHKKAGPKPGFFCA